MKKLLLPPAQPNVEYIIGVDTFLEKDSETFSVCVMRKDGFIEYAKTVCNHGVEGRNLPSEEYIRELGKRYGNSQIFKEV